MKRLMFAFAIMLLAIAPLQSQNESLSIPSFTWFDNDISTGRSSVVVSDSMLIDASGLSEGYHVVNIRFGTDSVSVLRNFLFYKPIAHEAFDNSISYLCWFDNDLASQQSGQLDEGILLSTDNLLPGYHVLNVRIGDGAQSSLRNFLFYKGFPAESHQEQLGYVCWFDNDFENRQVGQLAEGLELNTGSLLPGYHVVNLRVGDGDESALRNWLFYKPFTPDCGATDSTEIIYWFNDETELHRFTAAAGVHAIVAPDMDCGQVGTVHLMAKAGDCYLTPLVSSQFTAMDSVCCIAPLRVTVDNISDNGARIHWSYNRAENFTLAVDTIPFVADSVVNMIHLTDTQYVFNNLHSSKDYYYAVKTDCDTSQTPWVYGTWATICRTYLPSTASVCDSYEWRGTEYTESGVYRDTLESTTGYDEVCDSIFELNLTVHHSVSTTLDVTACRSYVWHDSTYTASTDDAQFSSLTRHGCDSTVTLHLVVNHNQYADSVTAAESCGEYTWHGDTYYTTGTYLYNHEYPGSPCPSVDTLFLTVNPVYHINRAVALFEGDSTLFGNSWVKEPGEYEQHLLSARACDSVETLRLNRKPVTFVSLSASVCQGEGYSDDCFTLSASTTSNLTGLLTMRDTLRSRGFDSVIHELNLTVMPAVLSQPTGMVPANDSVITRGHVVLKWRAVEYATGYRLYLWNGVDNMPQEPSFVVSQPYMLWTDYDNMQSYSWRVEAIGPCDTVLSEIQSFTINKQPILAFSRDSMDCGEIDYGSTAEVSVAVEGSNLTDSIQLTVVGTDAGMFTLSSRALWRSGGMVRLSFTPSELKHTYEALLVARSGAAVDTMLLHARIANYYVMNLGVPDSIMRPETPVQISGVLSNATEETLSGVPVEVLVSVLGRISVFTDTTDANGNFGCSYVPVRSECGQYLVGARVSGESRILATEEFNIPGVSFVSASWPIWDVAMGDTLTHIAA